LSHVLWTTLAFKNSFRGFETLSATPPYHFDCARFISGRLPPSLRSSYGEAGEDDLEVSTFIRRSLWLCGSVVKRFLSGTAFQPSLRSYGSASRVLDIFDGLSGGVVADSSTPGYLLSAFQAE